MILTTETWWTAREASSAAPEEGMKRRHGKGRRPTLQAVDRRLKRPGLGVETYDQKMLRRLEELAPRSGHSVASDPLQALMATRKTDG